jgi:hypothetical protein
MQVISIHNFGRKFQENGSFGRTSINERTILKFVFENYDVK